MRKLFFTTIMLSALQSSAQWAYKGLGGIETHQLTIHLDTIYASTNNGLYKKNLFSTDTLWQQVSFIGQTVLNTLFLDQNECLLLVASDASLHKAVLYKSANRGLTSSPFLPDTVLYAYPNLAHMAKSPNGKDTIYLLNHGKKTYDGGQNWTSLAPAGQYAGGNFIYVNPAKTREVFTGGENMIFAASLERSTDAGQNWQNESCHNWFAGDNALEVMHVVGDYWYAAGEGVIGRRHKDSTDWTQLVNVFHHQPWALYMFGFDISPANSDYMYVSGANSHSPAKDVLRLLKTSNGGISWDSATYSMPDMAEYGVLDLKVQHVWGEDRVWLGGRGVFTYSQGVPVGIGDPSGPPSWASIYPNPSSEGFSIRLGAGNHQDISVTVSNMSGQRLLQRQYPQDSQIRISAAGWAPGVYQVRVRTYEKEQILRFIKE